MNKEDINKILKNVSATLAIEGLEPSEKSKEITKQYLEDKISSEEAIKRIKEIYLKKEF